MGIAQGGDDCVEKPFQLDLLKAKIEAILRRTYQYSSMNRCYLRDDIYYDYGASMLYYREETLKFTKSERKIMELLMEHKPNVVSREEMMMALWDTDEYVSDAG